MNLKYIFVAGAMVILLGSCEKDIAFDLDEKDASLVVEATIENDEPPVVILSRSQAYFSKITPEMLLNSFVRNAEITVSNGSKIHRLKEYTINAGAGVTLFYYSIDSANVATAFVGEFNKKYNLNIKVDGKEYNTSTTIPALTKKIDSLWFKPAPFKDDSNRVVLMGRFTDPPGYGNYIRYFTKRNKENFQPGLNSVFDDQIVDGTTYNIEIERGVNRNEDYDRETYSFFKKGDTATIKFSNIDKATYQFWQTMEFSYASVGNPFSSPTKVLGNIKGALGYFGGYASQYKTVIIPK
jgi:Domain of unknown function (DUF4249)